MDTYYYLTKENSAIIKKQISIDKNNLQSLKREVLLSLRRNKKHVEEEIESTMEYKYAKKVLDGYIRNLKINNRKTIESNDFFSSAKEYLYIEYDEYEIPHLVQIIEMLLDEKNLIEGIIALNTYQTEDEITKIKKQDLEIETENLFKKMIEAHNSGNEALYIEYINTLSKKKNDLLAFENVSNDTSEQEKIYVERIKSCITINTIKTLDYNTLIDVLSFFEINPEEIDLGLNIALSTKNNRATLKEKIKLFKKDNK